MKRTVIRKVDPYDPERGVTFAWDVDSHLKVEVRHGQIHVEGNRSGLLALADCLIALTDGSAPAGSHIHLDGLTFLTAGSAELILEQTEPAT